LLILTNHQRASILMSKVPVTVKLDSPLREVPHSCSCTQGCYLQGNNQCGCFKKGSKCNSSCKCCSSNCQIKPQNQSESESSIFVKKINPSEPQEIAKQIQMENSLSENCATSNSFDVRKMKDDQNKTKSMDFKDNSEEPPFKKKKIEPKSKEEILKIRESILNDLSRDVKKFL
jgi:hypothetical protein